MAGKAIILSAPSGSGKSSLVQWLVEQVSTLTFSVSATTRSPREGEVDGLHYHFLSSSQFQDLVKAKALLEYEEVYPGRFYGTLLSSVKEEWDKGHSVIFDIDVQGGLNIKKQLKEQALAIYVDVPSPNVLEARLRARGTESEEDLAKRLAKAASEKQLSQGFDLTLMNDDLQRAQQELLVHARRFLEL